MSKTSVKFSEDIAAQVCGLLAQGYSLRKIEKIEGMPTMSAVMKWLLEGEAYKAAGQDEHPKSVFVEQYARARTVQADALFDETLDIADDNDADWYKDEDGQIKYNLDHINRMRLRVDTRKWMVGKLAPKKYGEKLQTENTNENVNVNVDADKADNLTDDQVKRMLAIVRGDTNSK